MFLISQFADALFLKTEVVEALNRIQSFSEASGLKLNITNEEFSWFLHVTMNHQGY